MIYSLLANAMAFMHLAFIVFVVTGGFAVLRWPRLAWVHLPMATWGVVIEFCHWTCPLTSLENRFLRLAGKAGYDGGFLAHYIFAIIYPAGLTRWMEIAIGLFVLVLNAGLYAKALPAAR